MENRFEQNPPEEQGWGAYATPPPIPGQFHTDLPPHLSLCSRVREMLPHLVENDGEVRPEMAREVYGHLSVCSGCAREFDEMQRVIAMVEALPAAEMPIDFSHLILERIQASNSPAAGREAYRPPVSPALQHTPRQEAEPVVRHTHASVASERVTDTGLANLKVTRGHSLQQSQSSANGLQKLTAAAVLTAMLMFLISSPWGRGMLGTNMAGARAWLEQIGDAVHDVPLLGAMTACIVGSLSQMGDMLSETYRTLGATAVQGLMLDAGLCAAAYYLMAARKSHSQMHRL